MGALMVALWLLGVCIIVAGACSWDPDAARMLIILGFIVMVLATVLMFYNGSNSTDSAKDSTESTEAVIQETAISQWNVLITAEDGSEVFSYEGAIDVEDTGSCIKFDGEHFVIPYRDTDTVEITRNGKCTCSKSCTCLVQK